MPRWMSCRAVGGMSKRRGASTGGWRMVVYWARRLALSSRWHSGPRNLCGGCLTTTVVRLFPVRIELAAGICTRPEAGSLGAQKRPERAAAPHCGRTARGSRAACRPRGRRIAAHGASQPATSITQTHDGSVALGVPLREQFRVQWDHRAWERSQRGRRCGRRVRLGRRPGACVAAAQQWQATHATAAAPVGQHTSPTTLSATPAQKQLWTALLHDHTSSPHSRSLPGLDSSTSGEANAPAVQASGTSPAPQSRKPKSWGRGRLLPAKCGTARGEHGRRRPALRWLAHRRARCTAFLTSPVRAAQPLLTPRSPDKLLPCRCSSASCGRAVLPPQLPGSPPVSWLSLKSRSMRLALVQLAGSGPVNRLPPRSIRWVARDSRPLGSGAPAGQAGGCVGTLVVWSVQNARASNLAIFPH